MSELSIDEFEVDVTDDDVSFFRANGYFSIERITTDEEIERLRAIFDELFAPTSSSYFDVMRPAGSEGVAVFPQTIMPELRHPELRDTTYIRNARRIAAKLLGLEEAETTHWGHMLDKPPGYGHAAPWHQDEAYWDPHSPITPSAPGCPSMTPRSTTGACGSCPAHTSVPCFPTSTSAAIRASTASN
jgi:hypothetical protein